MLIRFSCQNFRSFGGESETVLDLIPSKKDQTHPEHQIQIRGNLSALRVAAMYGANASGKSNFVKAIAFVKKFLVSPPGIDKSIPVQPFRLGGAELDSPSIFTIEFSLDDEVLELGFAVTEAQVMEEWLIRRGVKSDKNVYTRTPGKGIEFGAGAASFLGKKLEFLKFAAEATPANSLFVSEGARIGIARCASIRRWFRENIVVVAPGAAYMGLERRAYSDPAFRDFLGSALSKADTGIDHLFVEERDLPGEEVALRKRVLQVFRNSSPAGEESTDAAKEQKPERDYRILTVRHCQDGKAEVQFPISDESDGTVRLLHLAPMLYLAGAHPAVFVVDELERSMHPLLTRQLVSRFVKEAKGSQLIFTTHETTLLDLELLRRDEILFVSKNARGYSEIYSLADFDARKDLRVERNYLRGRFGAIPFLGNPSHLGIEYDSHGEASVVAEE